MRIVNRDFRKIKFLRIETLPLKTINGDIPVTWNTEKRAIAAKATTPLPRVITPDEWSRMRRASIAADSWLVGEQVTDEHEWWE